MSPLIIANIITLSRSPKGLHLCADGGKCFLRQHQKWHHKNRARIMCDYWEGLGIWLTSLSFSQRCGHFCPIDWEISSRIRSLITGKMRRDGSYDGGDLPELYTMLHLVDWRAVNNLYFASLAMLLYHWFVCVLYWDIGSLNCLITYAI